MTFRPLLFLISLVMTGALFARPAAAAEALHWRITAVPGSGGRMTDLRQSPHDADHLVVLGDMLGVGVSRDGGKSWQAGGFGMPSYEMGVATFHPTEPGIVWAGSMSGPMLSTDGGVTFEPRRQGMGDMLGYNYSSPVEAVVYDPKIPNRLLTYGGSSRGWRDGDNPYPLFGRVWQSDDDGESWKLLSTLTPDGSVPRDATDEHQLNIVAMSWLGDTLLAAVRGEGVYRSEDGGSTWSRSDATLPHGEVQRLVTHPSDGRTAWVALSSSKVDGEELATPGGIWKSIDGGKTWANSSKGLTQVADANPFAASRYNALIVSPHNGDELVTWDAGWRVGMSFRSEDGGETWVPTLTRANVQGDKVEVGEAQRKAIEGHDVQLKLETPFAEGFGIEQASWSPTEPGRLYGMGPAYSVVSDDGGRTFRDLMNTFVGETEYGEAWRGDGFQGWVTDETVFDPATPGKYIVQAMDAGRVWLTSDGGDSWTYHGCDPDPWSAGRTAVFGGDGKHIYAGFGQGRFMGLARSLDGGKNWDVQHGDEAGLPQKGSGAEPVSLVVDPRDVTRVFATIGDTLYESSDAGMTWSDLLERPRLGKMVNDPSNEKRVIIGTSDGLISVNVDEPKDIVALGGPNGSSIATLPDGSIFATEWRSSSRGGLWKRDASTGVWSRLITDRFVDAVTVDAAHPNRIAVTTDDHPFHDEMFATGPMLSDDGGKTWAHATDGLPVLRGGTIAFDPHDPTQLHLGTGGRGWFVTTWPMDRTLVGEPAGDDMTLQPPSAEGELRLINGSMEQTGPDNTVVAWSVGWQGSGETKVERDFGRSWSGAQSLKATSADDAEATVVQRLSGGAGQLLRVTGVVKTEGDVKVSFGVKSMQGWTKLDGQQLHFAQGDTEWTEFAGEVRVPDAATQIEVGFFIGGAGTVWLDDVTLEEVEPNAVAD